MIFELLRKPGPQDMKSTADAFAYFQYGMIGVGFLQPSKGRRLYMMFRGLVIMWSVIYLPLAMIMGCVDEIQHISPDEFLKLLAIVINIFGCSLKILAFYIYLPNYHKVKKLMNRMDEFCVTNEGDRLRIRYWVARCNVIFIIYLTLYNSYCALAFLNSALHKMPPYRENNPFIDWLTFITVQHLLVDVFNVIYCLMLRVHIEILRERVGKSGTDPEETERECYEELVKCIAQHELILKYSDLMRSLFSLTTFIQFILIGTLLGCTLVNLVCFSDFWNGLSCVIYIIGLMSLTFPFCYICDLIKIDCEGLALAIFHSNWIGSSLLYKSTIIQFIQRAQKPIAFKAGSIFPICMQTNIEVAKLAFSVVTFVKKLNIADKFFMK
ncbi:odorant receptor 98a-like [Drosophila tropicalis]|uniref:odorant receptor 98a-like n=1 Tax=Drosophila tropicalis TaxID=46794 RepID=UPI0035ABF204